MIYIIGGISLVCALWFVAALCHVARRADEQRDKIAAKKKNEIYRTMDFIDPT